MAIIPSKCVQRVTSNYSKIYTSSETEGCNEERLIAVRSEAMRPCYGQQVTQQSQSREMEWRLGCSHWRAIIIGTGRGVNDNSLGTCGGPKQTKCILGADKRVFVGCEIPGVSLGYDEI